MRVAIIGQGYVGLTIASFAADFYEVVGFDQDNQIVTQLNAGISHIEGVENSRIQELIKTQKYRATSRGEEISDAEIIIIAVPTPLTEERRPDLSFLESACKTIAHNLSRKALIINESTSFPGTVRKVIKPTIEKFSTKSLDHEYAISPERVDPGRIDFNQKNTPRLVSGLTPKATEMTIQFYSKFCDNLIEVTSPEVAEAAKLFENTFRQVNIALVNEFAQISHAIGINVHEVLEAASTKPYGFMKFTPSAGVGGHCIPVDPTYLASVAEEFGVPATFIQRANEVNLDMSRYVVNRVLDDHGGNIVGKSVLVVGVAYKPDVSDVRETAAALVIKHLKKAGAIVRWHDDVVKEWKGERTSPLDQADLTIVITRHSNLDSAKVLNSAPYVFDTTGTIHGATSF
jgi:UDP-N-acetyl-D-glucosamine dehydrogenase